MRENKHSRRTFSLCHKPPLHPRTLRELVSASHIYLHASSSRRSAGVHGLDVTGFAASDHKAPAHSVANNLGAKHQQEIKQLTWRSATLLFLAAAGTSPPSPQQFPHPSAGGFALKEAGLWRGKCGVGTWKGSFHCTRHWEERGNWGKNECIFCNYSPDVVCFHGRTSVQPKSVSELTVKVFFRKGPPGVCSSSGLTCLFRTVERDTKTYD